MRTWDDMRQTHPLSNLYRYSIIAAWISIITVSVNIIWPNQLIKRNLRISHQMNSRSRILSNSAFNFKLNSPTVNKIWSNKYHRFRHRKKDFRVPKLYLPVPIMSLNALLLLAGNAVATLVITSLNFHRANNYVVGFEIIAPRDSTRDDYHAWLP